ncbi:hypothetical protein ABPG75_004565 [Micractinium tetrahymenae]
MAITAAPAGGGRLHSAARAALHTAIAACLAGFATWLVLSPTSVIRSSSTIKDGLAFSSLSGSNTFVVLLTWASLLAATLLALALRRFLPASSPAPSSGLASQLPPRGFWANWCGGLSAGEAGGVAGWVFINAWWLGMLAKRSLKSDESTLEQLDTVAEIFGKLMAPNLMLLFLPIPHLSFVTWLTSASRNQLIRYHRWLGHGTLWLLTIHGMLYYIYWGSLVDGLRHRSITAVRVSGPNGAGEATAGCQLSLPDSWRKYDSVVMVGGGVGVTGLLSMLRSMAAQHVTGTAAGLPRRVRCIWVVRSAGELSSLDAPLLLAATSPKGVELSLQLTGSGKPASIEMEPPAGGPPALEAPGSGSFKESDDASSVGKESAESTPLTAPGASPFFFNRFRPVQPQSLGAGHLVGVYLLTYLGAFAGLLLAASYASQVVQWKGGMPYAVLLSALAVGLPFGLAVFPAHAFRKGDTVAQYWRHCRAVRQGGKAGEEVAPYGLCGALADSACVVGDDMVRFGDAALPVQRGRPDIPAVLRSAAAEGTGAVGVYVGGPRGMMASVHLTVARLNSETRRAGGPRFELHREAVEL